LTQNAEARTASALSLYPVVTKGFAPGSRDPHRGDGRKQRARPIPLDGLGFGLERLELSYSLHALPRVVNWLVGSGANSR
jgi:hypothetical protein